MSKIDIAPSPDVPSERVEFVEHEYHPGGVYVEVRFPGPTPQHLGTMRLTEDDWAIVRRVLGNAGPSVTFVRYSRQAVST